MEENINIHQLSFGFATRFVQLYNYLMQNGGEATLSKQLLLSGTRIGMLTEEAFAVVQDNPNAFAERIKAAFECSVDVLYWLRLLQATNYLSEERFLGIYSDAEKLSKLLRTRLSTAEKLL